MFISIKCPLMDTLVIHRDVITCVEFTLPCRDVLFCLNQKVSDVKWVGAILRCVYGESWLYMYNILILICL